MTEVKQRAVVTALGAVSAHGLSAEVLFRALCDGRSAVRPVTRFPTEGLCSGLAAEAPTDEALEQHLTLLGRDDGGPGADRATRLLLAAAAGLGPAQGRPSRRRGVVVGTTKGGLERALAARLARALPPEDVLEAAARHLAVAAGAEGPVLTVSAACASGLVAIGEALAWLEDGDCDEVLVGGTEALHPFVFRGFHALKALSAAPAAPFDAQRSGLSLGEGAAILTLTTERHAQSAGLPVLATLEGFGCRTDAHDQTAPDPLGRGLEAACRTGLAAAGLTPDDVDRYHAHGTATQHNDRMEAAVHRALFRGRPVPVWGIKGAVGHTLGAAGVLDVVACVLSLRARLLPPTVGLRERDPALALPTVLGTVRADEATRALVASAGFGGVNAAVVVARADA